MPKTSTSKSRNNQSKLLSNLLSRLTSTKSQVVIELPTRLINADSLAEALRKAGFYVLQIDAPDKSPIENKEMLMRAMARTNALPQTFGFNWDALVDSLSSLEQLDVKGYALILRQPQMLRAQSPEDYATFINVVEEVSARWAREGVPFKLLLPKSAA